MTMDAIRTLHQSFLSRQRPRLHRILRRRDTARHGGLVLQCQQRVSVQAIFLCSHPFLTRCSYIEGIVRGFRNSLLTSQNYTNLTQCETIDGATSS